MNVVEIRNVKLVPNGDIEAFIDPSGYVILYTVEPDTSPSEYCAPLGDPA